MKRIALLFLTIDYVMSQVTEPDCNFAADGTHNYPIGACVRRSAGSFKYICDNEDVVKYEYNDNDCNGQRTTITSDDGLVLQNSECGKGSCTYSEQCNFAGCADDCSDCIANPDAFDIHCLPWIEDDCTGADGLLIKDECVNGANEQGFYFGVDNCDGEPIFTEAVTDGECALNKYYTVTCDVNAPGGKGNGPPSGKGSKAVASDLVLDPSNFNGNNEYYNLFGFEASLLDLILIGINIIIITMCLICFGVIYFSCIANKTKGKYKRAKDEEYGDEEKLGESKSLF